MKIEVEELDKTVDVGGTDVYTHVRFAERLLQLATLAGIQNTTSGIWQVRDALPDVIREKVKATQTDWASFAAEIKNVERAHVREGVAKAKKAKEMEEMVGELARSHNRAPQSAPMTPIGKMAAQLARAGLQTPQQPARGPAPPTTPVNPFGGGGGGRGNLFAPRTPATQMGEEAKAQLERVAGKLGRALLADDERGRAEYARRINTWNAQFGNARVLLEQTGYLLSPGTVAPGSGECFGCGKVTAPYHRRAECPGPPIPAKESTFRSLCAKHLTPAPPQVNAVADSWIDFGDDEDFVSGSFD
jgi:hypothetical protein